MYILPTPQKLEMKEDRYYLNYDSEICISGNYPDNGFLYAKFLQQEIRESTGLELNITKGQHDLAGIFLEYMENCGEQGYEIHVDSHGIFLQASTSCGILYAVQTLRQIIRQEGAAIPYLSIYDYPEIKNRGLYYDVTRCRIPTLDYLKKRVDSLAFYKMNQLHLYIEHTYMFEGLSEVWRDDTPLTAGEILELDQYCMDRNIELVPSMATFGHLYKLLRTRKYRTLCEREELCEEPFGFIDRMEHHTLDVSNEKSFSLICSLMDEYMALFHSDKFNLCGDETFDLGKGKSKPLADSIGEQNLYVQFVKQLCEYLVSKGKNPMFWGDIICKSPDAIKLLPRQTICLNWGYSPEETEENTEKLWKSGARLYNCPGVSGWNQLVNQIRPSYENIKRMCTYGIKYHVEGILTTDWGDFGHINHPDMGIVGMIYGACFSWNKNIIEFEEINRQISLMEFGDVQEKFVKIISDISSLWKYKWNDLITLKEKNINRWSDRDLPELEKSIVDLTAKKRELQLYISKMDGLQKGTIRPYLMALDGMILLQKIGIAIITRDADPQLPESIEKWFYYYKIEWRKISKEGELYRVQEAINWIADYLRGFQATKIPQNLLG